MLALYEILLAHRLHALGRAALPYEVEPPVLLHGELEAALQPDGGADAVLGFARDVGEEGPPGPLVLFLHGAGERGRDNERQLTHGRQRLAEAAEAYGAAVVAPQCPWPDYWANVGRRTEPVTGRVSLDYAFRPTPNSALAQAMALLDSLLATGRFDTAAVHLVGISMGGMGVLELAARQPGRFASVTSLAGTYGPQVAPILAMTPRLRFFHGDEDPIVHHAIATELVAEIGRYGGAVDYTLYPGVNHGSWVPAFREPEFWSWVFEE